MNRLILIGNGFDLAHGMKTSYIHFIKWYLNQRMMESASGNETSDGLIRIEVNQRYKDTQARSSQFNTININSIDNWIEEWCRNGFDLSRFGQKVTHLDRGDEYPFDINVESLLLEQLINHCAMHNWVDVESVFYEILKFVITGKANMLQKEEALGILNKDMSTLIDYLQRYLSSLPSPSSIKEYYSILNERFRSQDFSENVVLSESEPTPKAIHVLNFNYTDTIERYSQGSSVSVNYIHGQLASPTNPIIFGFGDEIDGSYKLLEEEKAKGCFEFIKSFWYFRTNHYKDLLRFVEADTYQIFILGHSCGLSDRTMLHMLFEHPNCASIKIFYHGNKVRNNYIETTHEIARHFKDKEVMRERIVSLEESIPMPQAS